MGFFNYIRRKCKKQRNKYQEKQKCTKKYFCNKKIKIKSKKFGLTNELKPGGT